MAKHNISRRTFGSISCSEQKPAPVFTTADEDKIYSLALQSDPMVRENLLKAFRSHRLQHPSDEKINEIIMQCNNIEEIIDSLVEAYKRQVSKVADISTAELMSSIYDAPLPPRDIQEQEAQDEGSSFDDKTIAEIIRASAKVAASANDTEFANHLAPVTKSAVDGIVRNAYDRDDLKSGLLRYYVDTATSSLRPQIAQAFSTLGLQKDEQAKRTMVFNEINRFSFWNYLISIIL